MSIRTSLAASSTRFAQLLAGVMRQRLANSQVDSPAQAVGRDEGTGQR